MQFPDSANELLNEKDNAENLQEQLAEILKARGHENAEVIAYDTVTMLLDIAESTNDMNKMSVSEIVLNKNDLSVMPLSVITSPETAKTVLSAPDVSATMLYVDAPDGKETETAEQLREKYPEYDSNQVTGTPGLEDSIRSVTRAFFIIFTVTLLMIFLSYRHLQRISPPKGSPLSARSAVSVRRKGRL